MVPSQEASPKVSTPLRPTKVSTVSIRVSHPCGWDKSHTPWSSSPLSKTLWELSTSMSSQLQRTPIQRTSNSWSPSCLVTGLVSSALLYLTQLTQWSPSSTKETAMPQLANKSRKSTAKSVSRVSGMVLVQELSWLVLLPVSNGGSTTPSRLLVVSKQLEANDIFKTSYPFKLTQPLNPHQCYLSFLYSFVLSFPNIRL